MVEEIPDAGLSVLMCQAGDQDSVEIGCCHDRGEWSDVYGELLSTPSHWMMLPEVPMEGEVRL